MQARSFGACASCSFCCCGWRRQKFQILILLSAKSKCQTKLDHFGWELFLKKANYLPLLWRSASHPDAHQSNKLGTLSIKMKKLESGSLELLGEGLLTSMGHPFRPGEDHGKQPLKVFLSLYMCTPTRVGQYLTPSAQADFPVYSQ